MKICIKAWAWVGIEDRIGIGPGSNYNEGPKLGIGPGSIFRARDRIGIEILGIDPSLITKVQNHVKSGEEPLLNFNNIWTIIHLNSAIDSTQSSSKFYG